MSGPFVTLAEPLGQEEPAPRISKVPVLLGLLGGLGCAMLLSQSDWGQEQVSTSVVNFLGYAQPTKMGPLAQIPQPMTVMRTSMQQKERLFLQPARAAAKEPFSAQAWVDKVQEELKNPGPLMPEFGGSTGGLLKKANEEELYIMTWNNEKVPAGTLFEMPTGGAAKMNAGTNLLFLARKEYGIALGTQLKTKFKVKDYRIFRKFPNGELQLLHPNDGVFPEKVNAGRSGANQEMRQIGKNPEPSKLKFSGSGPGVSNYR